uniref:Uncharacterized protein n=1 Tax=Scophthalmus maximus TaxID=52904 RepID=A0A8D3BIH3_SCOMX
MATGESAATFESWLHQATDPNNEGDRWDCIQGFYQLVNQETDGPQVAIRLLAHKIQSPQEKEALQAVTVLEACMNNCGKRFHSEAAKYRFLNELIKVLTPKYFGAWTPQSVKEQVIKVLYGWTLWLKDEPKIQEVYGMLKKQGLVKEDPKLPDTLIMAPPPRRSSGSVFDQEDKAELLARLLKSARLEDLETANRLIKETIKEEQEKAEKVQKRDSTLKEVASSTKQLRDFIVSSSRPPPPPLQALYERCDRLRPGLFRLASDTMDDDDALAQILAANDDLALAVNAYKEQVGRRECNGGGGGRGGRRKSEEEEEVRGKTSGRSPLLEVCVETECPPQLLKHVFVPMDTIKSSHLEPITLYDQGGVHVSLHFARNSPAGRPGFAVVVISTVNTSAVDVNDFLFQAAVPKTMSVKLQPASGTHLPPYNPLLPPPAISQVVLLANPHRRKVRLRYKLTLTRGDQQLDETGEIDNFPDWNSLIGQ